MSWITKPIDWTIGRVVRWAGRQFAMGASADSRRLDALGQLATAVSQVTSNARLMGRGYGHDLRDAALVSEADGRAAAAAAAIADEELHVRLAGFRALARPFAEARFRDFQRDELETATDAVLERVRELR